MFKKKLLEELRSLILDQSKKLGELAEENDKLKKENDQLHDIIKAIKADIAATPSDCKIGDACRVCEFGRSYAISHGFLGDYVFVCKKHDVCPSFIAKEYVKESK